MLAAILDAVSSLFLFTVVVLLFAIAVAYFAPAIKVTQQGFFTVLAYLAGEVAVLFFALWIVSGIAGMGVLPMLLAIGVAALIFVPGLAAKIPVPANLGGMFKRS
jgi:hypothetical protein